MADVDDRGQLLIVGALTFAVMLVALAVLLNAAIYTGTVATRDAGTGSGEAIEYQGETTAMASDTMASLNARENASYADLRINFTTSVDAWSRAASTHASAALADAEVETLGDPTRGTKIQQDGERNFTSAGEAANWTVANDTTARAFRMNVSQSSLATPNDITEELLTDSSPSYFHAEFDDGSSVYRVQLRGTDDPDDSIVRVLDGAGNQLGDDCRVTPDDGRLLVDLTDASVDGGYCPALDAVFEGDGDAGALRRRPPAHLPERRRLLPDRVHGRSGGGR